MQSYVLGFCFNSVLEEVVLIRKLKPEFQKFKFNGVGGRVEQNETTENAMIREFLEETGKETDARQWKYFARLEGEWKNDSGPAATPWQVYCFFSVFEEFKGISSRTDEFLVTAKVNNLPVNTLPNVRWLIPMALSFLRGEHANDFRIVEC
jgi:8-oxo-dGTP diphosphatase